MVIGLGCMRLSTDPEREPGRSRDVLDAELAAGVDLLDTADAYGLDDADAGHNERLIAEAIGRSGARRVEVVTKGGLVRPGGAWVPDGRARHLADAARASRDRLGVAAIDLYLLHAVDPRTPFATSVRALAQLRDDGVVRRCGLSNVGLLQLEAALAIVPIDAVEVELSPWRLDALRSGLVAACTARGVRVLAHRPLGGPTGLRRAMKDPMLAAHAARLGATPPELILAWLRTLSPMVVPLPGASQVASVISAVRAAALTVDDEAREALAARFLLPTSAPRDRKHRPDLAPREPSVPVAPSGTATSREPSVPVAPSGTATSREPSVPVAPPDTGTPREPSVPIASPDTATPREVVMILGIPGSGKSTLAASYVARGYLRLNRDELGGSLRDIARRLDRALGDGATHAVLDNTYATRATRAQVIDVARRHGDVVRCVVMATSLEDAQANAVARILARHGRLLMPAIAGGANELARANEIDPRAQFRFRRDYEPPRADEGFAAIEDVPFVRTPPLAGRPALIVELDDMVWQGRPVAPEAIALCDGARDALHAWASRHVIAATMWRPGLVSVESMAARLQELLGLPLHVVHCAHPAGPPVCWCRKPLPGLALALAHAHGFDLARTLHLGRGPADRGFALRAGIAYADIAAGWPAPADAR